MFAILERYIYYVDVHALRLYHPVELTIPALAFRIRRTEDLLAPAVIYLHAEVRSAARQELAWEEVVVHTVTVRGKHVRYSYVAVVGYQYTV